MFFLPGKHYAVCRLKLWHLTHIACNLWWQCHCLWWIVVQYFRSWRQRVISMQPLERQTLMVTCFDNLMESVERNLQSRNKDKWGFEYLYLACREVGLYKFFLIKRLWDCYAMASRFLCIIVGSFQWLYVFSVSPKTCQCSDGIFTTPSRKWFLKHSPVLLLVKWWYS